MGFVIDCFLKNKYFLFILILSLSGFAVANTSSREKWCRNGECYSSASEAVGAFCAVAQPSPGYDCTWRDKICNLDHIETDAGGNTGAVSYFAYTRVCPSGDSFVGPYYDGVATLVLMPWENEENNGCQKGKNTITNNPVRLERGEKTYHFSDYIAGSSMPLSMVRDYSVRVQTHIVNNVRVNKVAASWNFNYRQSVRVFHVGTLEQVVVFRPDGGYQRFEETAAGSKVFVPMSGHAAESLKGIYDVSGNLLEWVYYLGNGTSETFGANGRLTALTSVQGLRQELTYTLDPLNSQRVTGITVLDVQTSKALVMDVGREEIEGDLAHI